MSGPAVVRDAPFCGVCQESIGRSDSDAAIAWDQDEQGNIRGFSPLRWSYCYRTIFVEIEDNPPRENYFISGIGYYQTGSFQFDVPRDPESVTDDARRCGYPDTRCSPPMITRLAYAPWWAEKPSVYPHAYTIHAKCWRDLRMSMQVEITHQLPRLVAAIRSRWNGQPTAGCGYIKDRLDTILGTRWLYLESKVRNLAVDWHISDFEKDWGQLLSRHLLHTDFGRGRAHNFFWVPRIAHVRHLPEEIHEMIAIHMDFSTLISYIKALGIRFGGFFWKKRLQNIELIRAIEPMEFENNDRNWEQIAIEIERSLVAFDVMEGTAQAVRKFYSEGHLAGCSNQVLA